MGKVSKAFNLPLSTKLLLTKAALVSLGIELIGKQRTYSRLEILHNPGSVTTVDLSSARMLFIEEMSLCLSLLEKHAPWNPMCYNRALTSVILMKKRGITPKLHIGFRKLNEELDGHAWVKVGRFFITGYRFDLHTYKLLR